MENNYQFSKTFFTTPEKIDFSLPLLVYGDVAQDSWKREPVGPLNVCAFSKFSLTTTFGSYIPASSQVTYAINVYGPKKTQREDGFGRLPPLGQLAQGQKMKLFREEDCETSSA